ncbi:hypothetical protein EXD76_08980 [BEV proteobacterium]|nr:hypothetical protein [Candidatus Symbiopectobacterium sp. Chty_BC]
MKVEPGVALTLRLVVVRLTDTHGKFIGRWKLLTNVGNEITSAEVARWYYWLWGIESFFKLLKGAGHDVEKWLQRNAGAVLRRLLIASMVCVLVWRLQRAEGDDNAAARQLICLLSGRQQKRGRKKRPGPACRAIHPAKYLDVISRLYSGRTCPLSLGDFSPFMM